MKGMANIRGRGFTLKIFLASQLFCFLIQEGVGIEHYIEEVHLCKLLNSEHALEDKWE